METAKRFKGMADVKRANRGIDNHWFDSGTMLFFNCRIETKLADGRYFISSETGPDEIRRYTIREVEPDGAIDTVGEFQQYETLEDARAAFDIL